MTSSSHATVSIGTFSSVCTCWLPDIIKLFRSRYENIDIVVHQGTYHDILGWIHNHKVDLAFISRAVSGKLNATDLYKDKMMCLVPNGFIPLNDGYITIDDIKNNKLILQSAGNNAEVIEFLRQNDLPVATQYYVEGDETLAAMVKSGLGIGLMPELVIHSFNGRRSAYPVYPEFHRTICLTITNIAQCDPATKLLHECIVEYVAHYMPTSLV